MAYQPKYAQKKPDKAEKKWEAQPVSQPERKKISKGVLALFIALGVVIIPLSSFLTGKLLLTMARDLGRPKAAAVKAVADMDALGSFSQRMEAQIYGTRTALTHAEKPEIPEQEIQVEPVRKVYWIEEDVLVAPEPDQSKFGKTIDNEELKQVQLISTFLDCIKMMQLSYYTTMYKFLSTFYLITFLSTSSVSISINSSRDIVFIAFSLRARTLTVPSCISRSPQTSI